MVTTGASSATSLGPTAPRTDRPDAVSLGNGHRDRVVSARPKITRTDAVPLGIVIRPRKSRSPGSLCHRRTAAQSILGTPTPVHLEGPPRSP